MISGDRSHFICSLTAGWYLTVKVKLNKNILFIPQLQVCLHLPLSLCSLEAAQLSNGKAVFHRGGKEPFFFLCVVLICTKQHRSSRCWWVNLEAFCDLCGWWSGKTPIWSNKEKWLNFCNLKGNSTQCSASSASGPLQQTGQDEVRSVSGRICL